ncbi:MAG: TIGR03668 family PPOX class F420-dependent oxidoreductase [Nitrospinota bacterium]
MKSSLTGRSTRFLETARVGHLATADAKGRPHVVPVVFVLDEGRIYTPIDGKPKGAPRKLRRIVNITENPHVAFLVDRYDENWAKLGFVLVRGTASILSAGRPAPDQAKEEEYRRAETLLRKKYPQYETVSLGGQEGLIIRITPESCATWGRL